ncbi:PucR family transcriptional regulator [Streptomyces tendae]|uniref:PucR family transcriptional regulator n=1 Tax=Streptomyces tendae TaxID=1932 RepID=UPI0036D17837
MAAPRPPKTTVQEVAEVLYASVDQIWDRAYTALVEIASYREIPCDALRAAHRLNVERAAATVRYGRLPAPADMAEAQSTTIARLRAGLPIEDIIRGYRLSISATFEQFVDIAKDAGLAQDELMKGTGLLWGLSDLFVAQAVLAHQRYAVEVVIGETRLRNDHVRAVLDGKVSRAGLDQWLPDTHGPFRALLARVTEGEVDVDEARLKVETALSRANVRSVIGVVDGMVTGYVVGAVPHAVEGLSIAVGHLVQLGDLPASLQIARRLLAADRDEAVSTVETCGWRLTVDTIEPLARHLRSRYVDPLLELGEFGLDLLATLGAYLESDRHVDRCAAALNLHPNSLRYRLRRLSDTLDVDLNQTDSVIALSMALELARRPASAELT